MDIKNPSILAQLERTGLNDKEALVYLSLLELGGAYPSRIASYSSLKRSTVYNILLTLSVRGLINEIKKGKKLFYQIEQPDRFIKYSEGRVKLAEDSLEKAKALLPQIKSIHGMLSGKPTITYYEGMEGIKTIYEDHYSAKKPYEMLAWADAAELLSFLPKKFFDKYVKDKEKYGVTTRGITADTDAGRHLNDIRYKGIPNKMKLSLRFAPKETFPLTGEIVIYADNKVSIVNFSKSNAMGIIIEDEKIHGMMKTIFNLSWESAKLRK